MGDVGQKLQVLGGVGSRLTARNYQDTGDWAFARDREEDGIVQSAFREHRYEAVVGVGSGGAGDVGDV